LQARLINHDSTDNIGIAQGWMNEKINESVWKTISYPAEWSSTDIGMFEGIMWSRKTIEIPKSWKGKKLTLELGPVDEMDATYFNGKKIGFHNEIADWDKDRIYSIPASMVKPGKNVIAIRIVNTYREGGLFGKPEQLKIYPAQKPKKVISLAGQWKYKIAYHFPKIPAPTNPQTPTFLYNSMIHPLLNMEIRGAIWYQGENNATRAYQYRKLFPAMIQDWRKNWSQRNFSFYFVQIAPYNYGNEFIGAELREAQLLTLDEVKNTGMAVIMDIGNPDDIHPTNKRDVGYRLARWALAHDYDKEVFFPDLCIKPIKLKTTKSEYFLDTQAADW
jgi:sialate O-acetylesterase